MFAIGLKLLAVEVLIALGRLLDRWGDGVVGLAERWMEEVDGKGVG